MTAQEQAEKLVDEYYEGSNHSARAFAAAITAALRAARNEAIEECAKWHDGQAAELQRACDAAWGEVTPDLGLHAIRVHREAAAALRAITATRNTE